LIRPRSGALIVVAATLIGGFLRVWNLSAAQFRGDDFVVSSLAIDLARRGMVPTGVLSSVGIDNGPGAPFILALGALVSPDHQTLSVWTALLNTAMIPVSYLLGRSLFGARAGVLAAVLTAVNPWLVIYGRRLWLNAFLGPAALAFLWALDWALRSGRWLAWGLAGGVLSLSAQIHLSSLPNILAFGSLATLGRGLPVRRWALASAVLVVGLLPWLVLSFWPDLSHFDFAGATSTPSDAGVNSLERATLVVTGVAYQSIAGQGGQLLDATAPIFQVIDTTARVLATLGWIYLAFVAWTARRSRPALAGVCLVMTMMVAAPALLLLRPSQAGQLPYLYPYYFINLIPPLLLGMAAVAGRLDSLRAPVGALLVALVALPQLLLAGPFFLTQEEFWPLGGYGVPWKYTDALVQETLDRARDGAIYVGGEEIEDSEQASVTARLLKRQHEPVRLYDSRDGAVYRDSQPSYQVTTNDSHILTRLLRTDFPSREIVTQMLPGAGWTRRVFRLVPPDLDGWADRRLNLVPEQQAEGARVTYERAGLVPVDGELRLGIKWRFNGDAPEPFFTDVIVRDGEREILRDVHVAYPAISWERGDWADTDILNLFAIPPEVRIPSGAILSVEHRGIITGKPVSPAVRFVPLPESGVSR
jgi:hypothetical protein